VPALLVMLAHFLDRNAATADTRIEILELGCLLAYACSSASDCGKSLMVI